MQIDGVKVFTVTKASDREVMGEDITRWLRNNPDIEILSREVRQSSDWAFHCISMVFFFQYKS